MTDPADPDPGRGVEFVSVPVDTLRPHPRNYRQHPEDQLAHIARSLQLHGFYRNVVIARDGTILAGHGVVLAARQLGWTTIPVRRLDVDPEEALALQVLTGDNEIANLGEVDDRALTELLRELAADDWDLLLGTGFDESQLAALAMVTRPRAELRDMEAAGEWLGLPGFEAEPKAPQITVKFGNLEDRDRFLAEHLPGSSIVYRLGDSWIVNWPDRAHHVEIEVAFELPTDVPA